MPPAIKGYDRGLFAMKRFASWTAVCATALAVVLGAGDATAVGTRRFVLDTGDDFKGGDLKGVAVDSTGRVRAGFNLGSIAVSEATTIWSLLPQADGSVLVGTGNDGKLLRIQAGKVTVAAETKQLVVTSLAEAWAGSVAVGTLPEGKLMKYERGKITDLAKLDGVEHVWQVVFDKKTSSVFAATGPEGKLFRVDQNGTAQVYFDAPEQHLMSVAVAPDGTVYTGASDKAKLYKLTGPGRASVLFDFARTEVRAIEVGKGGEVYAIANEIQTGSYAPSRKGKTGTQPPGPVAKPPKTKGKGTLYRFEADGTPDQLLDDKEEHFTSLAIGDDGKAYVGTGVEGRVYTVDSTHNAVLVGDVEERQIGAMVLAGKQQWIAGSDPAVMHPVKGIGGTDSIWTSKVLDAGLRAKFGKMSWVSTAPLELSTRTGNTKEPDDTWSPWSNGMATTAVVTSPAGRYLQVRARWSRDKNAVLREITIPFLTDNLRATITDIEASTSAKKGRSTSSSGDVTSSGGPVTDSADTKVSLSWKIDNPDKDELRFRLQYRLVGTNTWYDLLKPGEKLTKESYSWETSDLPEGQYRVRVMASDEPSNPPDRVRKHELESGIIVVDNTPPRIENLTAQARRVKGRAIDGVGPIKRIEIATAGSDEWHPFHPTDGIFDEQAEDFDADVSSFAPQGAVLLAVRVYDDANNFVVRNVALK
jgi:hypothetical protein